MLLEYGFNKSKILINKGIFYSEMPIMIRAPSSVLKIKNKADRKTVLCFIAEMYMYTRKLPLVWSVNFPNQKIEVRKVSPHDFAEPRLEFASIG